MGTMRLRFLQENSFGVIGLHFQRLLADLKAHKQKDAGTD
jgi:hypothetical protein